LPALTSEPDAMVAPLMMPPRELITPPLVVHSVPPEIVSSKSTWAPAPDAEMTPPLFMTTVSSPTLAFLPSAAIVLKLKISVLPALMNRPPLAVASSVPELARVFGSPRKIASALPVLALIVPLLIRARFAAPRRSCRRREWCWR